MSQINASIVLFNNDLNDIKNTIKSFLGTHLEVKLFLIDNSNNDSLRKLTTIDNRIEYIFNKKNLGYGKAHNIAMIRTIEEDVPYHLVLNPDIKFSSEILEVLYQFMENNKEVGNVMPKVKYPDNSIQYLCKLLPTPLDLIIRRFIPFDNWKIRSNEKYELKQSGYNKIMNVPNLSGCFMFLRSRALKEVGIFDENFFMYLEDTDLNRRIHQKYLTLFYPNVEITHEFAKESYKNKKLLMYHIKSAIYYFNKWGWIFDFERTKINKSCLKNDIRRTVKSFS